MKIPHSKAVSIMDRPHGGFTLLELLVTISVIAILAAFLVTSLTKTTEYSQQVKCTSNIRQLLIGWVSYCSDNNGTSVAFNYDPEPGARYDRWVNQIAPYVASGGDIDSLLLCPATKPPLTTAGDSFGSAKHAWRYVNGSGKPTVCSYGLYCTWYRDIVAPGIRGDYTTYRIGRNTVVDKAYPVIADSTWVDDGPWEVLPADLEIGHGWQVVRHGRGLNIGFSDGSVRHYTLGGWLRDVKWYPGDNPPHTSLYNQIPEKYR